MIYFIHDLVARAIKIGHGWDPRKRLSTLQISTPNKLVLLGSIAGTKRTEQKVHELVCLHCKPAPGETPSRPLWLQGEWFDDRILPFVTELMRSPKDFLVPDRKKPVKAAEKDTSLRQCKIVLEFDSGESFQEVFHLKAASPDLAMSALQGIAEARLGFLASAVRITRLTVPGCRAKELSLRGAFDSRDCVPCEGLWVVLNSSPGGGMLTLRGVKQFSNKWLHGVPGELYEAQNPWHSYPTKQCRCLLARFALALERSQCVVATRPPLPVRGLIPRGIGVLPKGELRSKAYRRAAAKRKRLAGEAARERHGVVYFIQDTSSLAVKIGFCLKRPEKRLATLQTGNANVLRLVGHILGSESQEKRLHAHLAQHHLPGEWFSPAVLGEVEAILRCGSVGEWLASQGTNLPQQAATATRLSEAGREAVILAVATPPEPETVIQTARRPAAADDVPGTHPAVGPDQDDLLPWEKKRAQQR